MRATFIYVRIRCPSNTFAKLFLRISSTLQIFFLFGKLLRLHRKKYFFQNFLLLQKSVLPFSKLTYNSLEYGSYSSTIHLFKFYLKLKKKLFFLLLSLCLHIIDQLLLPGFFFFFWFASPFIDWKYFFSLFVHFCCCCVKQNNKSNKI